MPGMDLEAFYGKESIVLMAKMVQNFRIGKKNQTPSGIKMKRELYSLGVKGGKWISLYRIEISWSFLCREMHTNITLMKRINWSR